MTKFKSIDPVTANEMLTNQEAILIDVREPGEHNEVHIANAYLMPVGTISIDKLSPEMRNKKIIVHCKMGKRSATACEKLLTENPTLDIYNIEGGIIAWENAGFKVTKL